MLPNRDTLSAYRALVEAADDVILIADWETVRFVDANQVAIDTLGYSHEELLTMTPRDLSQFSPSDHGRLSEELRTRGETMAHAVPIRCKDGTIVHMDLWVRKYAAGEQAFHVNVLRSRDRSTPDSADPFRAARGGLLVSEAFYRGVVTSIDDAVVISDRDTGLCVEANPAACELFGYAADAWGAVRRADLQEHGVSAPREASMRRQDGSEFIADIKLNEFEMGGRKLLVSIVRDMTERNLQAQRLRDAQAQMMHAQKLAAVGEVAAGVAHEINNPAAFISMNQKGMKSHLEAMEALLSDFVELAMREEDPERKRQLEATIARHDIDVEGMKAMLNDNMAGVERVQSVTRDLRMFSRLDRNEAEEVDLNDVVQRTVNLLSNELRHRAQVELELADSLPKLAAERGKLEQVLTNLLLNASQAIIEGGARDNLIRVTTKARNDELVLTVEDSGCGIPPEHLEQVFDPFFSTKPREQGVGLGLSLCVDILARHGGQIAASEKSGGGACFEVRIPRNTGLVIPQPLLPEADARADEAHRILVVDDNLEMVRAYERMLREHDAHVVSSGQEALTLLRRGEEFDLIICDLMMPDMDGPLVYEAIQAELPQHLDRVVFCTGGAFTPRVRAFLTRVEPPVIEKPLTLATLDQLLARG